VPATAEAVAREAVLRALTQAAYPVSKVEFLRRTSEETEVVANLISTSVVAADLDEVVAALRRLPGAKDAGWARNSAH
jgi:hypothetical protein